MDRPKLQRPWAGIRRSWTGDNYREYMQCSAGHDARKPVYQYASIAQTMPLPTFIIEACFFLIIFMFSIYVLHDQQILLVLPLAFIQPVSLHPDQQTPRLHLFAEHFQGPHTTLHYTLLKCSVVTKTLYKFRRALIYI